MIIWRQLFDAIRVSWRDRGSNCSRGHINCKCPWCGHQDPSQHLTINEQSGAYYCLRTPGRTHSGHSLPWLLLGLGVDPSEIDRLIEEHSDHRSPPTLVSAPARIIEWDRFEPAAGSGAVIEYLGSRGYAYPHGVAQQFGLRFTRVGRFSWRVLMPLTCPGDGGRVLAFTGRAIRGSQDPRYLTNDPMGGSLYVPQRAEGGTTIAAIQGTSLPAEKKLHLGRLAATSAHLLMVEGPFDALTLALAEIRLPAGRSAYYIPDADQSVSDTYRLIEDLEGIPEMPHVERLALPRGIGDVGEMAGNLEGIEKWLKQEMGSSRSGAAPSKTTRGASSAATPGA